MQYVYSKVTGTLRWDMSKQPGEWKKIPAKYNITGVLIYVFSLLCLTANIVLYV